MTSVDDMVPAWHCTTTTTTTTAAYPKGWVDNQITLDLEFY